MMDPALGYLLVLGLAALLGSAAVHKFASRGEFQGVLEAYRLLPKKALTAAARLVPAAESSAALGLLVPATRRYACLAAAGLFLLYACAIAVNLARGRRDLDCGCSLAGGRRPIAPWMLARNAALTVAALAAALPWLSRPLGVLDLVTISAGAAAAALLYASIDALLGRVAPAAALARAR
jgi:hypothetical protein